MQALPRRSGSLRSCSPVYRAGGHEDRASCNTMGATSPAMTRLVQIGRGDARAVALCDEPRLHVLDRFASVFDLAQAAIARRESLVDVARKSTVVESLDYDAIYTG